MVLVVVMHIKHFLGIQLFVMFLTIFCGTSLVDKVWQYKQKFDADNSLSLKFLQG